MCYNKTMMLKMYLIACAVLIAAASMFSCTKGASFQGMTETTHNPHAFKIATLNMYIGFDIAPLLNGRVHLNETNELVHAMTDAHHMYQKNEPQTRIQAMAKALAELKPDVIGLQEALLFSVNDEVRDDFIAHLMEQTWKMGGPKYKSLSVTTMDIKLPARIGDSLAMLGFTNREAIIYRSDLNCHQLGNGTLYKTARSPVRILGQNAVLKRGYVATRCAANGKTFLVFSTHLDTKDQSTVQEDQARELLRAIHEHSRPTDEAVFVLGDFNAEPGGATKTYSLISAQGFADIYRLLHPDQAGYTCCEISDLTNGHAQGASRYDHVFYSGKVKPVDGNLFANEKTARQNAAGTIWPSDHFGVWGMFEL